MHTRTHTDASRAPLFLLITIIAIIRRINACLFTISTIIMTISHAKSHASRAASPPDRQERGDSEVRLVEKKREAPEGACSS